MGMEGGRYVFETMRGQSPRLPERLVPVPVTVPVPVPVPVPVTVRVAVTVTVQRNDPRRGRPPGTPGTRSCTLMAAPFPA